MSSPCVRMCVANVCAVWAGIELAAVRADKEACELVSQALLLACEHTNTGTLGAEAINSADILDTVHVSILVDVSLSVRTRT